jgi:hypothetical protein
MRVDLSGTVATTGVALLFSAWIGLEVSAGPVPLDNAELRGVVGGITLCTDKSQTLGGYKCSVARTMACDTTCDSCGQFNSSPVQCALNSCWNCQNGGTHTQIRECRVSSVESDTCDTFGGPAACGTRQERSCQHSVGICQCLQPLNPTEIECPRKDCL